MKKFIVKTAGWIAFSLLIFGQAIAQDKQQPEKSKEKAKPEKIKGGDEIIIRSKSDKNGKVTIEIKDGEVFVNGKPVDEFQDDAIIVERRKFPFGDDIIAYAPGSPFRRGGWNFNGDEFEMNNNTAFLGVSSNKAESGGAEITEVTKESAAEKIGLKKGDIITKIDEIKIESPNDLVKAIHKYKPEDKVVVTYKRDGKEQKATAVLGKGNFIWKNFNMPEINENMDLIAPQIVTPRGFYGGPRTYSIMTRGPKIGLRAQDLEDGKGVKVIDVDEDSPAEKAGIKEGDIITQFDSKNVTSANELAELARANGSKSPVKIKITRAGKPMDIEVKIPKKLRTAEL